MTHEELLAVLREARSCVMNCTHPHTESLLKRVNAALSSPRAARTEGAERQDSAKDVMKHEKIEWATLRTECYLPENDQFLVVEKEFPSQQYCWFVKGSVPEERLMQLLAEGCCATEAEAKEAAIAAARGLK